MPLFFFFYLLRKNVKGSNKLSKLINNFVFLHVAIDKQLFIGDKVNIRVIKVNEILAHHHARLPS